MDRAKRVSSVLFTTILFLCWGFISLQNLQSQDTIRSILTHNVNGWLIQHLSHDRSGRVTKYTSYDYDSDGRVSAVTSYNILTGTVVFAYEYDSQSRVRRTTTSDVTGELLRYRKSEYDFYGNLVKETDYSANDKMQIRVEQDFGPNSQLMKVSIYDANDRLWTQSLMEYDTFGRTAKTSRYDRDGNLVGYSISYYYDTDGCLMKQESYDAEGNLLSYKEHHYNP